MFLAESLKVSLTATRKVTINGADSSVKIVNGTVSGDCEIIKLANGDMEINNNGNDGIHITTVGRTKLKNVQVTGGVALSINGTTGEVVKASSSKRYKKNIRPIEVDTAQIYKLKAKTFERKGDGKTDFGFIAEDVAEILPELVYFNDEGLADAVNYQMLSVLLLEENKKLNSRLKLIEAKLGI